MEIVKYEKKGNNNYLVYLNDGRKIKLNEDVILKYKLLYKKEIDEFLLEEIILDNNNYDIYNKCVKYIGVRLRSKHEIIDFMRRKGVTLEVMDDTLNRLIKNKLLDDDIFAKAFIKDKFKFTTMGPYRILNELKKHNIDGSKYISLINEEEITDKLDRQLEKLIKSNRNKNNLKTKLYNNLLNLGYDKEMIITSLNKYNL